MDDPFIVEVDHSLSDVLYLQLGIFLFERFLLLEVAEESALLHVLQNEVDVVAIVEEAVKFQDVFMSAVSLDFYLLEELVDHHARFYYLLADFLESVQRIGILVESLIHLSELTFSQRFLKVEVIDRHLLAA
jgi:hypothetical protein